MARRGTFGRSPRPAASLTNTIISIAREMQQKRDQNIVDAWMKGGQFEGHKVTDEMVLAYWKQRTTQVAKDDPMYDAYQNAYTEFDYSINESKMRTKYAQGKISAGAAAAFYLNWAKKVPKNSEFYRILQRDAAELAQAAKAKSDAEAKRQAEIRYERNLKSIYDRDIAPGQYVMDTFNQLAKRGIRPAGGDPLIDPMSGELYQFGSDDVSSMLSMIDRMTFEVDDRHKGLAQRAGRPTEGVADVTLYHDPISGKEVTATDFMKKLKGFGYEGNTLTLDGMYDFLDKSKTGLLKQQRLAESTGHLTDAARIGKQLEVTSEIGRQIKAWPVEQSYLDARTAYLRVVNDPTSSAYDKDDANKKYLQTLGKLTQDPRVKSNDIFINKLNAEIAGDESAHSLAEDFTGLNGGSEPRDIANHNIAATRAADSIAMVESGQASWTTGEWKDGQFQPSAGGSTIGPATPQQIANASGGIPTTTIWEPDKSGRYQPHVMLGQPLTVEGFDTNGNPLHTAPGTDATFGFVYVSPNGKQLLTYKGGDGHNVTTDLNGGDSPFGNLTVTEDGKGFHLRVNAPDPSKGQAGLANTGFTLSDGANGTKVLVYDPRKAALAGDPTRANLIENGGGDPMRDFRSPNIAYYNSTPEGQRQLYNLQNNDLFKQQVDADVKLATGGSWQLDEKGNPVIAGFDPSAYAKGLQVNSIVTDPTKVNETDLQSLYDREKGAAGLRKDERFDPAFLGLSENEYNKWVHTDPFGGGQSLDYMALASSGLSGTDIEAISKAFKPGTLNKADPLATPEGQVIGSGQQLKVPGVTPGVYGPPTPAPTTGVGGTNTGTGTIPTATTTPGTPTVNPSTGFTTPTNTPSGGVTFKNGQKYIL